MSRLYQVRVPSVLVRRLGKKILTKRFLDDAAGETWVRDKQAEFSRLKLRVKMREQAASVGAAPASSVTFRQAAAGWLNHADVSKGTRAWYQVLVDSHLSPVFRNLLCSQIGRVRIQQFLDDRRRRGVSADTLKRDLFALRAVLGWARDQGYPVDQTAWSVARPKSVPKITRRFDPDATERFIAGVKGRDRVVLETAAATGMRAGELRAFDVSWIRWDERRIHIPADQEFAPKSRKPRSIPLFDHLEAVLHEWLGQRESGLVFPPTRGGRGVYVRGIIKKAREASGVPFANMHDLRHHYLSLMAFRGVDVRTIQELAGHRDLSTSQRYLHVAPNYLDRARQALELSSDLSSGPNAKRPGDDSPSRS